MAHLACLLVCVSLRRRFCERNDGDRDSERSDDEDDVVLQQCNESKEGKTDAPTLRHMKKGATFFHQNRIEIVSFTVF